MPLKKNILDSIRRCCLVTRLEGDWLFKTTSKQITINPTIFSFFSHLFVNYTSHSNIPGEKKCQWQIFENIHIKREKFRSRVGRGGGGGWWRGEEWGLLKCVSPRHSSPTTTIMCFLYRLLLHYHIFRHPRGYYHDNPPSLPSSRPATTRPIPIPTPPRPNWEKKMGKALGELVGWLVGSLRVWPITHIY